MMTEIHIKEIIPKEMIRDITKVFEPFKETKIPHIINRKTIYLIDTIHISFPILLEDSTIKEKEGCIKDISINKDNMINIGIPKTIFRDPFADFILCKDETNDYNNLVWLAENLDDKITMRILSKGYQITSYEEAKMIILTGVRLYQTYQKFIDIPAKEKLDKLKLNPEYRLLVSKYILDVIKLIDKSKNEHTNAKAQAEKISLIVKYLINKYV